MENETRYGKISVAGSELIGRGGRADVYRLTLDTAVKVFHDDLSPELIKTELAHANAVTAAGLPAARAYEAVRVGDRFGIIYEYISGRQLGALISEQPDKISVYGRKTGALLKKLHSTRPEPGVLPDIKQRTALWTDCLESGFVSGEDAALIRDILAAVPDTGTLLHCDFHPGNLMVRNGDLVMIDLDDVCTGHPIFDLTFNSLLHKMSTPQMIERAMELSPGLANELRSVMLAEYAGTADETALAGLEHSLDLFGMLMLPLIMARSAMAWNITEEQAAGAISGAMPRLRENAAEIKEMIQDPPACIAII